MCMAFHFRPIVHPICIGIFAGTLLGYAVKHIVDSKSTSRHPRQVVQHPFINQRDIGLVTEDLDKSDGKGLPETYLHIGTNRYAFRYDTNGRPVIAPYRVEPQRVIIEEPEQR